MTITNTNYNDEWFAINTEPTIALSNTILFYTENTLPIPIDANATITDIDSLNFDTGTLRIRLSSEGQADDRLSIRNQGTGTNQINLDGK